MLNVDCAEQPPAARHSLALHSRFSEHSPGRTGGRTCGEPGFSAQSNVEMRPRYRIPDTADDEHSVSLEANTDVESRSLTAMRECRISMA